MSIRHPPVPADDAPFDDPDNPEWTEEMFARAMRPEELPGELRAEILAAFPRTRLRGRPVKATPKIRVAVRLDPDVVDHFRATGPGWQTRINDALARMVRNAGQR